MSETKTVTIEVPKKLYDAVAWYVTITNFWEGDEYEAVKSFTLYALRQEIETEVDGVPLARDHICEELKAMLEEPPMKPVPVSDEVYAYLERKARAKGKTVDEVTLELLEDAMDRLREG